MPRVHRHENAASFLDRAGAWLLGAEAEHNLILGVARRLQGAPEATDPPTYLATVEDGDEVVGCALRTPPHKLLLTHMPVAAIPALVEDVGKTEDRIPAVLGPEPEAVAFARLRVETRGGSWRLGMRQRLHQLQRVTPPARPPAGHMLLAEAEDIDLVTEWIGAFTVEVNANDTPPAREWAERAVSNHGVFLWEDRGPVSMTVRAGATPSGIRITGVYTPLDKRRRGYASALVARVSQHLLDGGARFCILYTDVANATSNHIYGEVGYRPVCDIIDVELEE